jgi:hypothetical protein
MARSTGRGRGKVKPRTDFLTVCRDGFTDLSAFMGVIIEIFAILRKYFLFKRSHGGAKYI